MNIELNRIYLGDTLETLKTWPDEFIQCVVTSPPYWGLRDYGVDGQIGLESTPDKYVQKIVDVFRQIRRCLKNDGIVWLNLGDSYAQSGKGGNPTDSEWSGFVGNNAREITAKHKPSKATDIGLKPKDLVGIPWRVAFALQVDGWYLRSDIIWAKPNPMPESVTDRPTKSHEYIFLLTKSERYYYNVDAIKEPSIYFDDNQNGIRPVYKDARSYDGKHSDKQRGHGRRHAGFNDRWDLMSKHEQCSAMRNKRSVWNISTYPYTGAHFATFPEEIPSICIKAGSREGDLILDPFMGSGTVAMIAKRLKRNYVGIELNPQYIAMAEKRISLEMEPLLVEP